jgi:hypothetical protein
MARQKIQANAGLDDGVLAPAGPVDVLQAHVPMRRSTVNLTGTSPSKVACGVQRSGLVVGGTGITNNQGRWSLPYSGKVLCGIGEFSPDGTVTQQPVVVATARGSRPALVTVAVTTTGSNEYLIAVRSFNLDGTPAGRTPFNWHAMSLTQFVVG